MIASQMRGARVAGGQGARTSNSSSKLLRAAPAARRSQGRRGGAVVVQANLFARAARVIKSYADQIVTANEDPEKILDQVVNEMQEDLIKMRQAAAQVMASQKQMEAKYNQAQATADDWLKRAELAVGKGEDELAREALKRRKAFQDQAESMGVQLEGQKKALDQLIANTRVLEGKLAEAKSKKDTLKARAASAKTSKQVQEMMGSLNTSNAVVAFDKMEEKVMAMEAESEAVGVLAAGDGLESKFAMLEAGTVDDELAALKKGVLGAGSKGPVAALPEAKPVKDAIDDELEALRKRAAAS